MGTFLTLAVVILLVWLVRKSGKSKAAPVAQRRERPSRPVAKAAEASSLPRRIGRDAFIGGAGSATAAPTASNVDTTPRRIDRDLFLGRETKSTSANECWIPPGRDANVAGYTIRGGMVYVGSGLASINGLRVEPALIDPSLAVRRMNPDRAGASMPYWPSYSSISSEARAAYLEWLSAGRRDPNACIGYVFLFFYGLERRALVDAPASAAAKDDIAPIKKEIEQLLQVYGSNNSFRRYATQLLDVLSTLGTADGLVEPPVERSGYDLPLATRVGIGRLITAGQAIPANWAWSWYVTHPETGSRTRTLMRRCAREFADLFRVRYEREYDGGLRLKPNQSKLKMAITPASASFGGRIDLSMDLPDIAALTAPYSKIRRTAESCATDLDAYSRWIGRNNAAPKTVAAVALLPPELATTHDSEEATRLWQWVRTTVGSEAVAVCRTDDLLQHCTSFGVGKLAKSEAVLLAQLLEKGGYGIEPDVRFGGAPLAPGGTAVLFRLAAGASPVASPEYAAATVLLHLAVAISAADGTISQAEEEHLEEHVERSLISSDAERIRLRAHLAWLMQSPPTLTGLRKRLDPLDQRQRTAIADFIVGVAGADGQISPDEIKTLGKIYPMLGLAADDVYSHVHAMAAGVSATEPGQPVTVISAMPSSGFTVPARPGGSSAVQLDMTAVKSKLAESAQISAILDDIFADDEPAPIQPIVEARDGKLPSAYATLLSRLTDRPEWSRAEFDELVAEVRLMPEGAIDTLNEAAFEHIGGPVLEGDDPIEIDVAAAKELLA